MFYDSSDSSPRSNVKLNTSVSFCFSSRSAVFRRFLFILFFTILLGSSVLGEWRFSPSIAFAATKPHAIPAHMTVQQFLDEMRHEQQNRPSFVGPHTPPPNPYAKYEHFADYNHLPPDAEPVTMQPIHETLTTAFLSGTVGVQPIDLVGSDHRLEVQIAPGSLDLSHASVSTTTGTAKPTPTPTAIKGVTPTIAITPTAPVSATTTVTPTPSSSAIGEPLTLVLTELHGHSAGEMNMLGSYQIQILDAQGQPVAGILFRQPIIFIYHYQDWEMTALDLDPGKLFFTWYDPTEGSPHPKLPLSDFVIPMHNDAKTHTLTVRSAIQGTGIFDAGGDPQNQSAPTPQFASVQGNAGQLSYAHPIQVAPAPDGFAPQLQLAYSSEAVNEQHSFVSPADAVGEGWSLSLGSISAVPYPSSSAAGANTWYFLSGIDGISDRLVQDTTIKSGTFYDTEHLSHLRIQQVTVNGEPCFHVWDLSSTYYQFGCTQDSLQYRKDSNGTLHIYAFDLNEIDSPNDGPNSAMKVIQVHYFQDCGSSTGNCPSASTNSTTSIRDAGIEQIVYGSLAAGSQTIQVAGTVDFYYWAQYVGSGQSQWAETYANEQDYTCSGTAPITVSPKMRCDDPQNYSGGANAPSVMSTLTLRKVTSYVGSDSGGYKAYEYDFSYSDSYFTSTNSATGSQCADPTTNPPVKEYCAGEHLLTQITPYVYKNSTGNQLKPILFHYFSFTNTYSDHSNPLPGGALYTITIQHSFMDYYFDTNTGVGAHIYYNRAYNNTHGTPYDPGTKDNRYDPLYCSIHAGGTASLDCNTSGSSFNYPDDHAWTVQVVTQITSLGVDSSGVNAATTTYSYLLARTGVKAHSTCPADSQGDTDCVGDNWLPIDTGNGNKDTDWMDFYHGEFRGFNVVSILSPSSNLTVDQYHTTEGWYTPEGDASNYNSGTMYQEDIYQGNTATSSALLKETDISYPGFSDSNTCYGVVDLTYVPCQVSPESSTTTFYDGTGSNNSNAPWITTAYTYDDYSPTGKGIESGYGNLLTETVTAANASTVTKQYTYTTTDSGYAGTSWIFYDVNKIAHSEIDDSSGRKWLCQSITYDEGAPEEAPTGSPGAGWPTTVNQYSSANCNPQSFGTPMITTYAGYDAYGNPVASFDGVASANSNFYGSTGISGKNGCTLSTPPFVMGPAGGKSNYTTCTVYDSAYNALPTSFINAFGQTSSIQYDPQQGNLPVQSTDLNGQQTTTSYSYDGKGNSTGQIKEPGETNGYTTQSSTNSKCSSSIPSGTITPCFEVDTNSSLYSTAVTETFYDNLGREVETRTPGPDSGL